MGGPRSAAREGANFPYNSKTVCFIEVDPSGQVSQVTTHDYALYERLIRGESQLYAVWPGAFRSDVFIIDDVLEYAKARNIVNDPARTGLQDHDHILTWQLAESTPRGEYADVQVQLLCGCRIENVQTFAEHMAAQKGWDVAISGGLPSRSQSEDHPPVYVIRVKQMTLR